MTNDQRPTTNDQRPTPSVPYDSRYVESFEGERSRIFLRQESEIERAIARLHADVVVQIQRPVDVDVVIVPRVFVLDRRQLECGELAGDRDVRDDVGAADE